MMLQGSFVFLKIMDSLLFFLKMTQCGFLRDHKKQMPQG